MISFNQQVYEIIAKIPEGRVTTYGEIARAIGRPRMARFVGFASNNKASWGLPWHRVVFKDGSLVPGWAAEQYKDLKREGVKFTRDKKVVMERYLWRPASEDTSRSDVPPEIRDWPLKF